MSKRLAVVLIGAVAIILWFFLQYGGVILSIINNPGETLDTTGVSCWNPLPTTINCSFSLTVAAEKLNGLSWKGCLRQGSAGTGALGTVSVDGRTTQGYFSGSLYSDCSGNFHAFDYSIGGFGSLPLSAGPHTFTVQFNKDVLWAAPNMQGMSSYIQPCASGKRDVTTGQCVECMVGSDCPASPCVGASFACVLNRCMPHGECITQPMPFSIWDQIALAWGNFWVWLAGLLGW